MIGWIKQRAWPVLQQTMQEWNEDDGSRMAAAMAYYGAFSFFPLMLVLLSGLGYFLRTSAEASRIEDELFRMVASNTSSTLAVQMRDLLAEVKAGAGVGGPLALATLLVGAMGIFAQLDSAFDRLWGIPAPESAGLLDSARHILHGRFKAFLLMLGLFLLVLVGFLINMVLSTISSVATSLPTGKLGFQLIQLLVSVALYTFVFTMTYTLLPKAQVSWRDALPSALLAAIVWEIGRLLLAAFVIGSKYRSAYGVAGSFIAIMAWMYYASTVLFLGAELAQVLCRRKERQAELATAAVPGFPKLPEPAPRSRQRATSNKVAYLTSGALLGALLALVMLPLVTARLLLRRIMRR